MQCTVRVISCTTPPRPIPSPNRECSGRHFPSPSLLVLRCHSAVAHIAFRTHPQQSPKNGSGYDPRASLSKPGSSPPSPTPPSQTLKAFKTILDLDLELIQPSTLPTHPNTHSIPNATERPLRRSSTISTRVSRTTLYNHSTNPDPPPIAIATVTLIPLKPTNHKTLITTRTNILRPLVPLSRHRSPGLRASGHLLQMGAQEEAYG